MLRHMFSSFSRLLSTSSFVRPALSCVSLSTSSSVSLLWAGAEQIARAREELRCSRPGVQPGLGRDGVQPERRRRWPDQAGRRRPPARSGAAQRRRRRRPSEQPRGGDDSCCASRRRTHGLTP
jgi:hypothetical protein